LLILVVSATPYGGVALWAQTVTGLLCLTLGCFSFRAGRQRAAALPPFAGKRFFILFFAWTGLIAASHGVRSLIDGTGGCLPILSATLFIWCAWTVLAVATRRIASRTHVLRMLMTGIAIIASAQALVGIVGLYVPLGMYSKFVNGARAAGTFSSGNSMGGFLALSLPPTLAMAQLAMIRAGKHIRRRRSRILHEARREDYCLLRALLWLLATLVQTVALLLSGSRGAISAALVTLLCLCAWFARNRDQEQQRNRVPVVTTILVTLLVLAIGAGGTYALTLRRLKELETAQQAALPRTVIWQSAIKQVARQPLGAGPGRFAEVFLPFQPPGYGGNRVYHAHNDYLQILIETGIPGLFLLLAAFGSALGAAVRRLLQTREGESVWMRRAALLSVAAGLIHASVDFNLSSRPGVAALFFCLLGAALSRSSEATAANGMKPRPSRRLCSLGLAALCSLLALNQLRLAAAATLMEQGLAAITGESSLYFWLPVPDLSREQALGRMRRACWLAPDSAEVHRRLARALVLDSDRRLAEAIRAAQAETPEVPARVIDSRMRILMRMDEARWLSAAQAVIDKACLLAPDNADVATQAAIISARLASLAASDDGVVAGIGRTLEHVGKARERAPNDATIQRLLLAALSRLADALARVESPVQRDATRRAAMETGLHLLHLGESRLEPILKAWSRLGLDAFAVLETVGPLPADAAAQLYHFYNRQQQASSAIRALDTLDAAIKAGRLSSAGFRDTAKEAEMLGNYRLQLIRERARWHLRQHQFGAYRESASSRQVVLTSDIERKLTQTTRNAAVALRFRYLNLRELHETRGLDAQHARELAVLMEQHGESDSTIANVLAPFLPAPAADNAEGEQPEHRLDMHLLGGQAVFIGFSIREGSLHTFWRFHARVASDLQAVFMFRDSQHEHVTSAAFLFSQAFGREFAVGAPPPGRVFRATTPIPPLAALSEHLDIGLRRRSTGRWLPSIEGLNCCEIHNWKGLERQR
jgi:O-antigen ligase